MKPLDKHPYEPPVAEIFELKTECVLLSASPLQASPNQDYELTGENPFASNEP